MTPSRIELLQHMPIFGAIGEASLNFLVGVARPIEVPGGTNFFLEGDPASSMFVLESGRVEVLRSWKGRELVVQRLSVGDCFGEMALLDLSPRSATVRAIEDCRAIELSHDDLYRLYERDAEQFALIQMNLAREMSRRLRATDDMLFRAWMGEPPEYRGG